MKKTISSIPELAKILQINEAKLRYLTSRRNFYRLYSRFSISKKSGGSRYIEAPRKDLKTAQKRVAHFLEQYYRTPKCVFGFVKGRSIVDNAKCHLKRQAVVTLDIKDFFGSITQNRVMGLLMSRNIGFPYDVARLVAALVCTDSGLPQGSPASPLISNMICRSLDKNIMKYTKDVGAYYSRYADDITLSFQRTSDFKRCFVVDGKFQLPSQLEEIICFHNGFKSFEINYSKTRYAYLYKRQSVTGLVVNQKVNLAREHYRELRSCLWEWENKGISAACTRYYHSDSVSEYKKNTFEKVLRGQLDYYLMVLGENAFSSGPLQKLGSKYNSNCTGGHFPVHKYEDGLIRLTVSGEENIYEATGFYLKDYGIVTAQHTFEEAIRDSEGFCEVDFQVFPSMQRFSAKINVSKLRVSHPKYDYLLIPIVDAPDDFKKACFPFLKSEKILLTKKKVQVFQFIVLGDQEYTVGHESGTVSKVGRKFNAYGIFTKIDCPVFHGMSGGPVLDANGKVVGIIHRASNLDEHGAYLMVGAISKEYCEIIWQ